MEIRIIFIFLIILLKSTFIRAQITPSNDDRFSTDWTVSMLTNYNGNPTVEGKTGWNLIFKDNFDGTTLNTNKWNVTGRDDDFPGLNGGNVWGNPANVSVSGGACHLKLTNVPTWSQGNAYKPFSGAEIKTFTEFGNTLPNYYFGDTHYGFGVDTYIEMRVKMPGGKGAGSAGWLWQCWAPSGHYREYDIWETYGNFKPKQFANTYIYGTSGYAGNSLSRKDIETNDGRYIDVDWYVFAIERTAQGYKSYINGQLVRDLKFTDAPPCDADRYDYWNLRPGPTAPLAYPVGNDYDDLALRLTAISSLNGNVVGADGSIIDCNSVWNNQTNHLECDGNFNKEMLVDYVRVYQKQSTNAVKIKQTPKASLCTNNIWDFAEIKYTWYPDAVYTWTYPAALNKSQWHRDHVAFGFNQTLTPVPNQTYPITLTITFPSGYVETKNFNISTLAPVAVTPTMLSPQATRTGVQCFYRLSLSGTRPAGVTITSNPPVGFVLDESSTYQVQICAQSICGGTQSCVTKTLNTGSLTGCRGWVRPDNGNVAIDNEVATDINSKSNSTEINNTDNYNTELDNETVVSIKDIENNTILKKDKYSPTPLFYPNPIQQGDALVFNTLELPEDECVIMINDALGSITQKVQVFKYQKAFITTDNLTSGMYFVAVYNKNGQYLYAQKLIIQ